MKILFTSAVALLISLPGLAQKRDSLDIKIGQMLMIGFAGQKIDSAVLAEVASGKAGSLIIFEKNIPPANSFIALKKIIWNYQKAAPIPLIVAIDQEGGRVNRLKTKYGFPASITATQMNRAKTLDSVSIYAEATASTLAGLGINMNFAPVVDLGVNPVNPIIAKLGRAFSADADSVILMSKEFIKSHRKYGVLTSMKHFPGHGSSKDDTHLGMADVTSTWSEIELKPYQALIDSGYADAIMSSHIVNKKLEPDGHPGTLSDDIINGLLRRRLRYNGVVFTDDMQMHAITKHYPLEDAVLLAINAGVDIMIFSNNISGSDQRTADKVHAIIRQLVEDKKVSTARIDESYRRIMKLKQSLKFNQREADMRKRLAAKDLKIAQLEQALAESKDAQNQTGKKKKRKKRNR